MRNHLLPLVAVLSCGGCADGGKQVLEVGVLLDASTLALPEHQRSLLWVLQPLDYVRCESQAREIRKVQRQATPAPALTILAVGGHDDWARAYVQRERLQGSIISITERSFVREFGRRPVSALYIIEGSRVVASFPVSDTETMDIGELADLFQVQDITEHCCAAGGVPERASLIQSPES